MLTGTELVTSGLDGDELLSWTVVASDVFVTWAEVRPVVVAADETLVPPVVEAEAELVTSGLDGDELFS